MYTAVQDKEGFIWFGTESGLSRFDGSNFENFTIEDGLPDNEILRLFVDSKNRVWIISFKNALCYYHKGRIFNESNDSLIRSLKITSLVVSIAEDKNGNILVVENRIVHFISRDTLKYSVSSLQGRGFFGIHAGTDELGNFLAAVDLGYAVMAMLAFDAHGERLIKKIFTIGDSPNAASTVIVSRGIEVLRKGAYMSFVKHGKTSNFPLPKSVRSASVIGDSILCLNTSEGSYIYNCDQHQLINHFLKNEIVNSVFSDDSDNWWFCTSKGVFRLLSTAAKHFTFESNGRPSSIYCIAKFDSSFYFGSDNYRLISLRGDNFSVNKFLTGFSPGRITSLVAKENYLILGTDDGVYSLKPSLRRGRETVAVKSIVPSGDHLVVASNWGVTRLSLPDLKEIDAPWIMRATYSLEFNNRFFVGTLNGLYRVDSNGNQFFYGSTYPKLSARISALAKDNDNLLWVTTYGYGLFGIKNDSVRYWISTKEGLSSNTCRAVLVDSNSIWVVTDKGLDKIQFADGEIKVIKFTEADGLPAAVINCIFVDGKTVYVGSSEGVTRFDGSLITQKSTCRLSITGVQIGSEKKYYDTTNFQLPHNYTQLRFDFSGISFKSGGDITYYYRLLGLNNTWQTTRTGFLNYPSLPSGDYILQLYAVNKFGVKSNKAVVPFSVKKLFWETLWFQVLAGILVLSAIWIFIVLRIRWLKKKKDSEIQLKKRMMEMEQMALKAQMNPHFIFNCLNSIQQYVLEKDFASVNRFITDFASLIRKTLEASSKTEISLEEELEYISTYLRLEKARLEDKFNFKIELSEDVDPSDYFLPPMLLQPCLENSIRHGIRYRNDNLGKIHVHIKKNASYLYCIIEDNGIGRKLAQEYKGLSHIEYQSKGTELTASRMEMLTLSADRKSSIAWEDIVDTDGQVLGTRVILKFPLEIIWKA